MLLGNINRSYLKQKTGLKWTNVHRTRIKRKTITFNTKHDRNDVFTMNGKRLESLNSLSYLGIMIDKKLCFREHSKREEEKLVQFCWLFYKLRKILNRSQLIKIFNTYVKPVVQYGILVYGTANKATMRKIDAKINRVLRVIFFSKVWLSFSHQREIQRFFGPGASSVQNFQIDAKMHKMLKFHHGHKSLHYNKWTVKTVLMRKTS